jgi:G6PDH family F420-dependent oxidoreductase
MVPEPKNVTQGGELMAELGYFLSSEENGPRQLMQYAQMGEQAGLTDILISDHYHPWIERQGESPFVWSVIGAIAASTNCKVTTGVTCPTVRIHPAIIAQAAATSSLLLGGKFVLGVGSGEALNEHILGTRWPEAPLRLEMLEEAVDIMRELWRGEFVSHHGKHYTVENARIYSAPDQPIPVYVSGFGPMATALAARIGDGYVNASPSKEGTSVYRREGGRGPAIGALKVCWGTDEAAAQKLAYDLWKTTGVPGELNQELPMPGHFEQAAELVTEDQVANSIPCGPDPERHLTAIREYFDAGYDQVYIGQIGEDQAGFLDFFSKEIRPRLE